MAIVNCPECNEKISSKAKTCIHCGVELTVCPECESVYAGKVEVCPQCGFVLCEQQMGDENEKTEAPILETAKSAETKWKNDNFLIKYKKAIINIFSALGAVLVLFAGFTLISWVLNDDKLYLYSSMLSDFKLLATIGFICWYIECIYEIAVDAISCLVYQKWASNRNIKLSSIIEESLSQDFARMYVTETKKEAKALKLAIDGEVINRDVSYRKKVIFNVILQAILGAISMMLIGFFVLENVKIYMQAELMKSDFLNIPGWSISMVTDWEIVFVGVIVLALSTILQAVFFSKRAKLRKEWVKVNMPENLSKFEKYVQDVK